MRISIVGAGSWGTALALVASKRHEVTLYARSAAQVGAMKNSRENTRYLPGFVLPPTIALTSDLAHAAHEAELIVVATPVAGLREMGIALAAHRPRQIVCVCKGLESQTNLLPHQVIADAMPGVAAATLSGPSFASEVAAGLPVALTAASADEVLAERIVHTLHGGAVRVYRSSDVVGVEVGGAVKNVMAIAAGICDGLELGANARAALLTRGLSEMMRFGVALGGSAETLMGLTGVGDLILTCTGSLSRNRRVGLALGQGSTLDATLTSLGHVAEGVQCARAVKASAERLGIEMPITIAVAAILFDGMAPRVALGNLLARAPRYEH
jgi:glycerol-3-phosphate dehydrogenase (NAD(P)+)